MIKITVENREGETAALEIPCNLNLSLMEALKAAGYDILATCGGLALCATCHVKVLKGTETLPPAGDQELDMLEMLPDAGPLSRLACQLRINEDMDGMIFRIANQD
ncbi:MAG TPA: ferredoxin [Sphingobacteriaceae bacterium]|jgi:2Fe-2S ferredoxin|nr:ferredoxin [Sphingobacteriaceae bacterium]